MRLILAKNKYPRKLINANLTGYLIREILILSFNPNYNKSSISLSIEAWQIFQFSIISFLMGKVKDHNRHWAYCGTQVY